MPEDIGYGQMDMLEEDMDEFYGPPSFDVIGEATPRDGHEEALLADIPQNPVLDEEMEAMVYEEEGVLADLGPQEAPVEMQLPPQGLPEQPAEDELDMKQEMSDVLLQRAKDRMSASDEFQAKAAEMNRMG